MDKSSPFQTNIDECRFHARQNTHHFALVDVPDNAFPAGALYVGFLQHAVFYQGHPRFHRGDVDKNLFTHNVWLSRLRGQFFQTG